MAVKAIICVRKQYSFRKMLGRKANFGFYPCFLIGGGRMRTRTADLLRVKQAL